MADRGLIYSETLKQAKSDVSIENLELKKINIDPFNMLTRC